MSHLLATIFLSGLLLAIVTAAHAADAPTPNAPAVEIARWQHDAAAAYSIILDDFGPSFFGDIPAIERTCQQYDVRVAFATIAGGADDAAWQTARRLFAEGHEFLPHSMHHREEAVPRDRWPEEIDDCQALIEKNIPGSHALLFCFPGPWKVKQEMIPYMRTRKFLGVRNEQPRTPTKGIIPAAVDDPFEDISTVYHAQAAWSNAEPGMRDRVNQAIAQHAWALNSCHNVGTGGWEPIALDTWTAHLAWAAALRDKGQLWIAPPQQVLMYALERNTFTATIARDSAGRLSLTLTPPTTKIAPSPLIDNTLFTVPLTVKISTAKITAATQSGQALPLTHEGADTLLTASPWKGPVTLTE